MMGRRDAARSRFGSQAQIREHAKTRLAAELWDWMQAGAGDQLTLAENTGAFAGLRFRPRYMRGISKAAVETSFLGVPLSLPVLTAPFGCDTLFHPQGHLAVASACAQFGTASLIPEACGHTLERIAAQAPAAARFFQIAVGGDEAHFLDLARRAQAAGYTGICVLIDSPVVGWKDGIRGNGFNPDPASAIANYGPEIRTTSDIYARRTASGGGAWDWDRLSSVARQIDMPFVVKGALTPEDALAAEACGASGVIVSNLGGRSLDAVPASLTQLPAIAQALDKRIAVALDSGIRRGSDILKALALGADVVVLGRLTIHALAADGEAGVLRMLELLKEELETTMLLAGVADVRAVGADVLMPAG